MDLSSVCSVSGLIASSSRQMWRVHYILHVDSHRLEDQDGLTSLSSLVAQALPYPGRDPITLSTHVVGRES